MGGYYRAPPMDRGDGAPVPYCDEDGDDDDDGSLDYERLLRPCRSMEIRRVPRGCPGRRMCGCGPPDEFRYYVRGREVAYSFEVPEAGCCCCCPRASWTAPFRASGTGRVLFAVHRPRWRRAVAVSSGGRRLGDVRGRGYWCVPSFAAHGGGDDRRHEYTLHPPTCGPCGCAHPCADDDEEEKGCCCPAPYWIFPAGQRVTDGPAASHAGKIAHSRAGGCCCCCPLAQADDAYKVLFPQDATASQKAVLVGASLLFSHLGDE